MPLDYRPGKPIRERLMRFPHTLHATIELHFLYYTLQIALSRLILQVMPDHASEARKSNQRVLVETARSIVDATKCISLEPSTPLKYMHVAQQARTYSLTMHSMISYAPTVAMFTLFDFVMHNPSHPETPTNLVYLDIVNGYFQRFGIVSESQQRVSLLARLIMIAKQYVDGQSDIRQASDIGAFTNRANPSEPLQSVRPPLQMQVSGLSPPHGAHSPRTSTGTMKLTRQVQNTGDGDRNISWQDWTMQGDDLSHLFQESFPSLENLQETAPWGNLFGDPLLFDL